MKEKNCFNCKEEQSVDNKECISCIHSPNLTDNFKEKQNELDNLFIGVPIMIENPSVYHKLIFCYI